MNGHLTGRESKMKVNDALRAIAGLFIVLEVILSLRARQESHND